MENKKLKIAIDIDNTITASIESMAFFALLTNSFKGKVDIYIITSRDNTIESISKTKKELERMDIHYDQLVITSDKAGVIIKEGINIFFEDTDEFFQHLPPSVVVFKIREFGNFDFTEGVHKWIYGDKTGVNYPNLKHESFLDTKYCDKR